MACCHSKSNIGRTGFIFILFLSFFFSGHQYEDYKAATPMSNAQSLDELLVSFTHTWRPHAVCWRSSLDYGTVVADTKSMIYMFRY